MQIKQKHGKALHIIAHSGTAVVSVKNNGCNLFIHTLAAIEVFCEG